MNYNTWMPAYGQLQPGWQPQRPELMQGYPQSAQSSPVPSQSQPQGFIARPVASREEAVAAQIDFFGPGILMPDFGHNAVYFKRFNQQTGACDFMTFRLEGNLNEQNATQEETKQSVPEYATKRDLQEIQSVVQGLADELKTMRGGKRIADE